MDWIKLVEPRLVPSTYDRWIWLDSDKGVYSVRDGYQWLRDSVVTAPVTASTWNWIWKV